MDHLQQGQGAKKKYQTVVLCALGAVALLGIIAAAGTSADDAPPLMNQAQPCLLCCYRVRPHRAPTRLVWEQVGDDLIGVEVRPGGYGEGGLFGSAVSFSSDGTKRIAVRFDLANVLARIIARALCRGTNESGPWQRHEQLSNVKIDRRDW
jgi:hypothetical protein